MTPSRTATATPVPLAIQNGTFLQGVTAWTTLSARGRSLYDSINKCAILGGVNDEIVTLSQTFIVPSTASILKYKTRITSEEADASLSGDIFQVIFSTSADTVLSTVTLDASLQTSTFVANDHAISSFRGQTVTLTFYLETDSTLPSTVRIDDIAIV